MNMDFPHPRHGLALQQRHSDFAGLIALAAARQTMSITARAMLARTVVAPIVHDSLDGRIAYFARRSAAFAHKRFGAFLPPVEPSGQEKKSNDESAVYLADSTIRKSESVNRSLLADGQESRGMEA
jgi:hypothetical protein